MLDLAISIDSEGRKTTVVETNHGLTLRAPGWPQDCDFQLVAFGPSDKNCEVVWPNHLAEDISKALTMLDNATALKDIKPDWYHRLRNYAQGASSS